MLDSNSLFYDEAADIYSFAIVLWETFTGGHPFESYRKNDLYSNHVGTKEDGEIIRHFRLQNIKQAIIHDHLRPVFDDPENLPVPKEVQGLITACWHTDKDKRLRFDEICSRLVELMDQFAPGSCGKKLKQRFAPSPLLPQSSSRICAGLQRTTPTSSPSPLRDLDPLDSPSSSTESNFKLKEQPNCIHFACNKVWVGCNLDSLVVFNAKERKILKTFKSHGGPIHSIVSIARKIWVSTKKGSLFVYYAHSVSLAKEIVHAHKGLPIQSLLTLYRENTSSVWSYASNRIIVWNAEVNTPSTGKVY